MAKMTKKELAASLEAAEKIDDDLFIEAIQAACNKYSRALRPVINAFRGGETPQVAIQVVREVENDSEAPVGDVKPNQ